MRISNGLLASAAGIAVLFILSLSFNAVFWSDDYAGYFKLEKAGNIWRYLWHGYLEWDGRYLSVQSLVQILFIRYLPAPAGVFLWSLCLLWLALMLKKIIALEMDITENHSQSRFSVFFIFILLWYGFSFHINDTVYWVTGGVYILSMALCLSWVYFYLKNVSQHNSRIVMAGFIFSLMVGLSGINVSIPLLAFAVIDGIAKKRDVFRNLFPVVQMGGLVISSLFSVLAPGNYIRASFHENSFTYDVMFLVVKATDLVARYIYYSLPAITGAFFLSVLFPISSGISNGLQVTLPTPEYFFRCLKVKNLVEFIKKYRWFLIAFSGVIPFLFVPDFSSRRTSSFFMLFLFIGVFGFFSKIFHNRAIKVNDKGFRVQLSALWVQSLLFVFFIVTIVVASSHFYIGSQIRSQIHAREAKFDRVRGQTEVVYVEPIRVNQIPFSSKFHDLLNHAYAKYHGFESVQLDTTSIDDLPGYYIKAPR